jgi:hypothetical protein
MPTTSLPSALADTAPSTLTCDPYPQACREPLAIAIARATRTLSEFVEELPQHRSNVTTSAFELSR